MVIGNLIGKVPSMSLADAFAAALAKEKKRNWPVVSLPALRLVRHYVLRSLSRAGSSLSDGGSLSKGSNHQGVLLK